MIDAGSYVNKTVQFKFNGVELRFDLSHALFSSFDIDVGTRLLLKAAARDPVLASARRILDEGCGVGVIGLCAAKALPEAEVLLRDRDSLAVAFTERNRLANKLRGSPAWTDPETGATRAERPAPRVERGLLGDGREDPEPDSPLGEGRGYDFVFSNLPAKAGGPVLAHFFDRLSGKAGWPLLVPGGRAGVVIVNPLAEAAAAWIAEAGLEIVGMARGGMHKAFIVERRRGEPERAEPAAGESGGAAGSGELEVYSRGERRFKLADFVYKATGFYGLPEFDTPGFGSAAAAELAAKVCSGSYREALFLEPGVGHLAIWAARVLGIKSVTGASRDELSLRAVGYNLSSLPERARPGYAALDALYLDSVASESQDLVFESPDVVPERDWIAPAWNRAERLLREGGVYIVYCSPTEMTRLERRRPSGVAAGSGAPGEGRARWSLLGQKRRKGFIASAWRKG